MRYIRDVINTMILVDTDITEEIRELLRHSRIITRIVYYSAKQFFRNIVFLESTEYDSREIDS